MTYNFRTQISPEVSLSLETFYGNIYKTDYCWPWQASVDRTGYGCFTILINGLKKSKKAHRISYALHHNQYDLITDFDRNLVIHHRCNNKLCCNPDHLELVTSQQNCKYALIDGLIPVGERQVQSKLTNAQVRQIRDERRPDSYYATLFNVSTSLIQKIRLRVARKHG